MTHDVLTFAHKLLIVAANDRPVVVNLKIPVISFNPIHTADATSTSIDRPVASGRRFECELLTSSRRPLTDFVEYVIVCPMHCIAALDRI